MAQLAFAFESDPVQAEIRRLGLKHTARCPVCDGAGGDCPRCAGWGRVPVGCSLRAYITGCRCPVCLQSDSELGVNALRRLASLRWVDDDDAGVR